MWLLLIPSLTECIILLLVGIIVVYSFSIVSNYWTLRHELDKFPGPKGYPIIGSSHLVLGPQDVVFKKLRKITHDFSSSCFVFWVGLLPTVNVTSPEDTEIVISSMKNHGKGFLYDMLHCWLGTGLLTSRDDKWRIRRKVLTPSFHFNVLQQFLKVFIDHTAELVNGIKKHSENNIVDVHNHITKYTLNTICETAMGTSVKENGKDQETYMSNVYEFGKYFIHRAQYPWLISNAIFSLTPGFWRLRKICERLHKFSSEVITKREVNFDKEGIANILTNNLTSSEESIYFSKKRKLAMLDVLLSTKYHDGTIDNDGIREEVDTFIFEGHDTTGMSLCFSLMLLACNRDCQDKAYEEIMKVIPDSNQEPIYNDLNELKYTERCIKESLRLYPSVPFIARVSDGVTTSKGLTIPKGCMINIHIFDIHRRPEVYPDPERFDPDRFLPENSAKRHPYAYIPFSAGPRNCIGQKFAMMEMKAVIVYILRNFILEPIDTPETINLIVDIVLRTKNGIKVKFVPRVQS